MASDDEQARIDDQIAFYREQVRHEPADWDEPEVQALVHAYFEDPEVLDIVRTHCPPSDRCLELASGPGRFTGPLLELCRRITAVDASAEMHDVNRAQHGDERIEFVVADLFEYQADDEYDLVFAGHWLSHVPAGRFDAFWSMVRGALAPGGKVVMVDDGILGADGTERFAEDPTGRDAHRRLADGREFTIVKIAHDPRDLEDRLAALGWHATVTVLPPATYVLTAAPI